MKKLIALLLALVMVFALAACGGEGETTTTEPPADDTTPVDDTTPPEVESVTLNIGYMNNYGSLWSPGRRPEPRLFRGAGHHPRAHQLRQRPQHHRRHGERHR